MSKLFLTADLHLGHANIIKYCDRPFKDIDTMNNTLINNWNSRVKPEDEVIIIGDWCFKNSPGGKEGEGVQANAQHWESLMNGHKVFIRGNHDKNNSVKSKIVSLVLYYSNNTIFCIHDPQFYNNRYEINFVGHVHNNWKYKVTVHDNIVLINIGVDVWKFAPVEIGEAYGYACRVIREEIKSRKENQIERNFSI